jgi:pimeloyl-ACP methyl ester carboxylesterase
MLEMLNPSAMDMLRFASQTLQFRHKVQKAYRDNPQIAYALAADKFSRPPESARREPNVARLKDDSQRYFGWSSAQWKSLEPSLEQLVNTAKRSHITHLNEKVQCYHWKHAGKTSRGKILFCHGWEGYAFNFAAMIKQATDNGWEVIAFDHLAHGNSGGKHSGIPIALSTLLAVAKQFGSIDIMIGHSLGAAATAWAAAHKKIKIKRLIQLAPFYDTFQLTQLWVKAHLLNDIIRAGLQAELEKTTSLRFDDFMPSRLAPILSMPVLIIHDPKDPVTAFKHSRELASLNEHVTLEPALNAGHVRILAEPSCVDRVMAFCD